MLDLTAPVMPSRVTEWVRVPAEIAPMLEREGWVRYDVPEADREDGIEVMRRVVAYV